MPRRFPRLLVALGVAAPLAISWTCFNGGDRPLYFVLDLLVSEALLTCALLLLPRVRGLAVWLAALVIGAVMAVMRMSGAHFTPAATRPFSPPGPLAPLEFLTDLLVCAIGTAAVLAVLVRLLPAARPTAGPATAEGSRPLRTIALLLLAWTPYYLIYFPGILIRDSWSVIFMAQGEYPLINHHPVLSTLAVRLALWVASIFGGGVSLAVAIHSAVQAIILATGLAVATAWVGKRYGRGPRRAVLAFFALNPLIALNAITLTKDTMFFMWMVLLTVLLAEAALQGVAWLGRPRPLAAFGASVVGISFTRNNGPYIAAALVLALAALLAPALFRGRRESRQAIAVSVVGVLVLVATFTIQGPGYRAWGVGPSPRTESVGLQLQQLAWANKHGTLTPEQQARLSQLMPLPLMAEKYSPTIVDSIKFDPAFNKDWLEDHPDEFRALWLEASMTNRDGYAQAWYAMAGGYMDPGRVFVRVDSGTKRGSRHLEVHDKDLLFAPLGVSGAPQGTVRVVYDLVTFPGINLGFRMPLVFWFCGLGALAAVVRRRPSLALPYLPFLLLVGTLLVAAPLTEFRYVLPGHVAMPLFLLFALRRPLDLAHHEETGTAAVG